MAQYVTLKPDDMLECPYDKSHMIRAQIFQNHLINCKKNHTGKNFVTCPFNAIHVMPKSELRHHLTKCPDKAIIEQDLDFGDRNLFKGCTDTPVYNDINIPVSEDWDCDALNLDQSKIISCGKELNSEGIFEHTAHVIEVSQAAPSSDLFDKSLYAQVKFKPLDRTRNKLNEYRGAQFEEEDLRLPATSSVAARTIQKQPQVQPRQQPDSSAFAYSVMAGRGRGYGFAGQRNDENTASVLPTSMPANTNIMPVGRGMANGAPVGVGRGLVVGYGRGSVAPPPGFCVPKINQARHKN